MSSLKTVEVVERRFTVEVFPPDGSVRELDVNLPSRVSVLLVGTQGPPGASGAGFVFTQETPETEWVVPHNLGFHPAVEVIDEGSQAVNAHVVHISLTQLRIYFNTATAGQARCV